MVGKIVNCQYILPSSQIISHFIFITVYTFCYICIQIYVMSRCIAKNYTFTKVKTTNNFEQQEYMRKVENARCHQRKTTYFYQHTSSLRVLCILEIKVAILHKRRTGKHPFKENEAEWSASEHLLAATSSVQTLPENGPSAPVEEALRYRFSNRHPQTETLGSVLGYRVTQLVPLAPICTGWKNQPVPLRLPR